METLRKNLEAIKAEALRIKNWLLKKNQDRPPYGSKRWRILKQAELAEGKDISRTENELGCVESVHEVLVRAGMYMREKYSTTHFYEELMNGRRFRLVKEPLPGDIIISPTYTGQSKGNGHIGIVGMNNKIWSNNSRTYLWDTHFSLWTWKYYFELRKFPIYYFRVVENVGSTKLTNKNMKYLGAVVYSSVDPKKISLTLKAFIPLALALLPIFGIVNVGESDLVELINQLVVIISGVLFVYGFVRKLINNFGK